MTAETPLAKVPVEAANDSRANVLELDRICLAFGDKQVLKGVDLDVKEGEVVVLIGASGSGKTSLLRCINQLRNINIQMKS